MEYKRAQRVGELLKHEISHILSEDVKDPAVGMVTITAVTVTDDLKQAKVYVSVLGSQRVREKSLQGLERAKAFIRSEIRTRTDLKFVPELHFFYDNTLDYAEHIEDLLRRVKEKGGS